MLGLLTQIAAQRVYDTRASQTLAKPFEAACGSPANAQLQFTAFYRARLDAPTPAVRAHQAESQAKVDRLRRAEATEAEAPDPTAPGLR